MSCDAVMCTALRAHGFPAGKLVVLGRRRQIRSLRSWSSRRPRYVRCSAAAWPSSGAAVLASFGSGTGAITVRVVAPHGASAYQTSLHADLAGRKTSGAALLKYSRIAVSATARSHLVAGQADSRLLLALALLAGSQPIDIVRFGNLGPGASPGVPLRFADLAESSRPPTWTQPPRAGCPGRPEQGRCESPPGEGGLRDGSGPAVLRVEFAAPSPLGKSGSG